MARQATEAGKAVEAQRFGSIGKQVQQRLLALAKRK